MLLLYCDRTTGPDATKIQPGLSLTPYWDDFPLPETQDQQYEVFHSRWLRNKGFQVTLNSGQHYPNYSVQVFSISVPTWFILPFLLIYPMLWLHAKIRRRQICPGTCPSCHYDLRAHAPGQKCPECGTVIEAALPSPPK
jgi:hypothetical protein